MALTSTDSEKSKPSTGKWMTAISLLLLAIVFLPTGLLVLLGLLPTIAAFVTDRDPQHTAALTVGPLNFAGVMFPVIDLWTMGHNLENSLSLVADPFTWGIMFGMAAIGWFIYYAVPPLVAGVIRLRAEAKEASVTKAQQALIEEWGGEVVGGARAAGELAAENAETSQGS